MHMYQQVQDRSAPRPADQPVYTTNVYARRRQEHRSRMGNLRCCFPRCLRSTSGFATSWGTFQPDHYACFRDPIHLVNTVAVAVTFPFPFQSNSKSDYDSNPNSKPESVSKSRWRRRRQWWWRWWKWRRRRQPSSQPKWQLIAWLKSSLEPTESKSQQPSANFNPSPHISSPNASGRCWHHRLGKSSRLRRHWGHDGNSRRLSDHCLWDCGFSGTRWNASGYRGDNEPNWRSDHYACEYGAWRAAVAESGLAWQWCWEVRGFWICGLVECSFGIGGWNDGVVVNMIKL
jgi:hypothetical protein